MKIAGMIGTDGGVSFAAEGFHNALGRVGENTGNTLFQRAMWNLVKGPKVSAGPGVLPPETLRQVANILVIPAANQINPHFKMDAWADYIEAADLPCLVVGLGAQSDDPSLPPEALILPEAVARFARIISERSQVIGVRGEFTKRVLASLGVNNTVITGCPSQTLNLRVTGDQIARNLDRARSNDDLAVAILGGTLQEYTRGVERTLYSAVKGIRNHICVYQTEPRILRFLHERHVDDDTRAFVTWMNAVVRPDLRIEQFFHYLVTQGRVYSDARSWIDAMRRMDVTIGMRIHGAVAAIQAGRLGICIAFDSRTLELARTMGVPYIIAHEVKEGQSLKELLGIVHFEAADFDEKRKHNVAAIMDIVSAVN
ncbi:polysaccharide pyruvyl transferase family protein [Rhizobium sp. CNPSo 4039]|uniref:polysaccharide pyruvyl transferase family protein n=1 Tax=Rhizobium sp. CNPSo 4039 TaxID=3021409 RepID=UPI00254C0E2F|nr:polysaccharide pyruvyl transferase family protein [Rhizobium sp. CNPSo 4039]MDK4713669.1 polysaccharide pyruvyl transferase family protein [Rhizobium sp. CNPSo 4039]